MNNIWIPGAICLIPTLQADMHQLEVLEMNDGSGNFLNRFLRKSRLKGTRYATAPVIDGRQSTEVSQKIETGLKETQRVITLWTRASRTIRSKSSSSRSGFMRSSSE